MTRESLNCLMMILLSMPRGLSFRSSSASHSLLSYSMRTVRRSARRLSSRNFQRRPQWSNLACRVRGSQTPLSSSSADESIDLVTQAWGAPARTIPKQVFTLRYEARRVSPPKASGNPG